jgi:hypothetical protein
VVNDHAAEFYPIPRGQAGQVECDADVVNPADLYDGASAAVFENAPERFPIANIWRAREAHVEKPLRAGCLHRSRREAS